MSDPFLSMAWLASILLGVVVYAAIVISELEGETCE